MSRADFAFDFSLRRRGQLRDLGAVYGRAHDEVALPHSLIRDAKVSQQIFSGGAARHFRNVGGHSEARS